MRQPALTFVHGFMGHPSDWDEVRAELGEFESTAISLHPAAGWHSSVKQLADSVRGPTVIVGYSMGARLSLGLAIENPAGCKGLIFISGNPGLESDQVREQRWIADKDIASRLRSEAVRPFLQSWYEQPVFATVPDEIRSSEIERKLARQNRDWPDILLANSISRQPDYWPRLHEIDLPIALIAGETDEKYRKIAVRFAEVRSNSRAQPVHRTDCRIIPDCGHIVHREQPAELVRIIREFLSHTS